MVSAWRNFKNIFPRPLFIIKSRPEMLKFHPYSIFAGDTRVEFVIQCVLIEQYVIFSRWVFNWAHWSVGNITFILAIIAIFFAMEYPAVDMPSEVTYVLITYVVVHVVVHMVLTIQRFYLERMAIGTPNKGELLRFDFHAQVFVILNLTYPCQIIQILCKLIDT